MALTLTPPPGTYNDDQTISVTGPANVAGILVTTNGSDPVIVKTIASSDKPGTEYPYSQTIDDGRGRAIFDGAFAKAYNSRWNAITPTPTTFAELDDALKLLHNCIQFVLDGGTQLLALGDKNATLDDNGNSYFIKDSVSGTSFYTTLTGVASILGITMTIKDRADYAGNLLNPTFAELSNYDAVLIISSNSIGSTATPPSPQYITNDGIANIAQARRSGIGVYVLTDNGGAGTGTTARYPESYYATANYILAGITNANFQGTLDFSPGRTVGENKALHGDSPIFDNMADTDIVFASTTDSYVNQDASTLVTLPTTVSVTTGYTTLKFAVVDDLGNVTFEQYGYNVGQPPIVELCDASGTVIQQWPETNLRQRQVHFLYTPGDFTDDAAGFVKVGEIVVGEFTNVASGIISVSWLDTEYSSPANPNVITMPASSNLDVHVELYEPVPFIFTWNFDRFIPTAPTVRIAQFVKQLNKNEFASGSNYMDVITKARTQLQDPSVADGLPLSIVCRNIYTAMT